MMTDRDECRASLLPFILAFATALPEESERLGATRETKIDRETTDDD